MKKITNFLPSALSFITIKAQVDSSAATGKQDPGRSAIKVLALPFFILSLFCSSALSIYGQTEGSLITKIYLQTAIGPGTYNSSIYEFSLQAILKNNWSTTFSYHSLNMKPKTSPLTIDQKLEHHIFLIYQQ